MFLHEALQTGKKHHDTEKMRLEYLSVRSCNAGILFACLFFYMKEHALICFTVEAEIYILFSRTKSEFRHSQTHHASKSWTEILISIDRWAALKMLNYLTSISFCFNLLTLISVGNSSSSHLYFCCCSVPHLLVHQ